VRPLLHHLPIELSGSRGDDGRARYCRVAHDDPSLGDSLCALQSHMALRLLRREDPKWKYVEVRSNQYLNNPIEQDHRAIKRRCAAMVGGTRLALRPGSKSSNTRTGPGFRPETPISSAFNAPVPLVDALHHRVESRHRGAKSLRGRPTRCSDMETDTRRLKSSATCTHQRRFYSNTASRISMFIEGDSAINWPLTLIFNFHV
jgi:hypothetical protein